MIVIFQPSRQFLNPRMRILKRQDYKNLLYMFKYLGMRAIASGALLQE